MNKKGNEREAIREWIKDVKRLEYFKYYVHPEETANTEESNVVNLLFEDEELSSNLEDLLPDMPNLDHLILPNFEDILHNFAEPETAADIISDLHPAIHPSARRLDFGSHLDGQSCL